MYPTMKDLNEYEPTPERQYDLVDWTVSWESRIQIARAMFWQYMDPTFCRLITDGGENWEAPVNQFATWLEMLRHKYELDTGETVNGEILAPYMTLVRAENNWGFGSQYFWMDSPKTVISGPAGYGGMSAHLIPHYHEVCDELRSPTYLSQPLTMRMMTHEEGKAKYGIDNLGSIQIKNLGIKNGKLFSIWARISGQRFLFTPYKQKQDAMKALQSELLLTELLLGFSKDDAAERVTVVCMKDALENYNGLIRVIRKRIYYVVSIEPPNCCACDSMILDNDSELDSEFIFASFIKFIYGIPGHSDLNSYGVWFDGDSLRIWCTHNGPIFDELKGAPLVETDQDYEFLNSAEFSVYKKRLITLRDHPSITGTAYTRYRLIMCLF